MLVFIKLNCFVLARLKTRQSIMLIYLAVGKDTISGVFQQTLKNNEVLYQNFPFFQK
jgi:hypothetical protein